MLVDFSVVWIAGITGGSEADAVGCSLVGRTGGIATGRVDAQRHVGLLALPWMQLVALLGMELVAIESVSETDGCAYIVHITSASDVYQVYLNIYIHT